MNDSQNRALRLLNELINANGRQTRLDVFLCSAVEKPPPKQFPEEWAPDWCKNWAFPTVPNVAAAFDIQLTLRMVDKHKTLVWTQGSGFNFREATTIYDAARDKTLPWGEQSPPIRTAIFIKESAPAVPATSETLRNPGTVSLPDAAFEK